VHPETKIREAWIRKLDQFAPAGSGTAGPALPTYLLDRNEPMDELADAGIFNSEDMGSCSEESAEEEGWRFERRVDRWSCDAAAQDRRWQRAQDEEKVQRAREAAEWDAAHGAEREAEHAAVAAQQPDFYWALACPLGRRPKWQLRKGDFLEADATCIIADDEPLLLYRGFRSFRADGDLMKATQIFGGLPDHAWLDAERAMLEPSPTEATRPSLKRRCIECGQQECVCPDFDDPARDDMYGGGSADCGIVGPEEWQKQQLQATAVLASDDHDELEQDRTIEEQGRISRTHGRPWHEVPPGTTAPVHWLDSTDEGGPVDRPWERAERAEREREERELRDRKERMTRANIPPPHREDERYGPLAGNREGDEAFRKDRAVWYGHVTGESLEGLSLTKQWERVDVIARRFRDYSDGRQVRRREEMPATRSE
jgi:hypothetical protein